MVMVKLIISYLIENIYQFYKKYLMNLNKTHILLVENEAPNRKMYVRIHFVPFLAKLAPDINTRQDLGAILNRGIRRLARKPVVE